MKKQKQKQVTLTQEKYEEDIMMFGVFLMDKVKAALHKPKNLTVIIEDEFKKYEKQYLKNGSLTD